MDDAERLEAWKAGLDHAIAEIRAAEGFDGETREWRTLGDVVGMRTSRDPVVLTRTAPGEAPRPIRPNYRAMSGTTQRLQGLASQDIGRLVG